MMLFSFLSQKSRKWIAGWTITFGSWIPHFYRPASAFSPTRTSFPRRILIMSILNEELFERNTTTWREVREFFAGKWKIIALVFVGTVLGTYVGLQLMTDRCRPRRCCRPCVTTLNRLCAGSRVAAMIS